ncbi:adenosylcobinamide-phosphate synthase CbiB [Cetobacterium sp.]
MNFILKIWIAYLLDLVLSDPYWFPHPVRFIGKYITFIENRIYSLKNKRVYGGLLTFTVILTTGILSYHIAKASQFLEIFFLYTTLATKSLGAEGIKVYKILKSGDLKKAQKELSYLVSRDTGEMDEIQVVRSTMETIAENSVDGVIAPMFYAFLGSLMTIGGISLALPLAMGYKAVNTLDSMVGYKNDRYIDFGMVSAKVDDFFNFIPARLSGLLIIPIATFILGMGIKRPLKVFFRDRKNHSSPNSGHSEAVFAGAIGVQFGGKTKYFGKYFEKPTIGDKLKEFQCDDIKKCYRIMFMTSFVGMILFTIFTQLL